MDFTEAYSDRCSAVGLAAREGNAKVLQKLIGRGYSLDVLDNRGWMPIHEAAAHNSSKCLRLLINAAPSDNYIHSKTFEGMSALHLSARCGSLECVGVLLEAGVDPDQLTTESNTALFLGDAFLKPQSDCYVGEAVGSTLSELPIVGGNIPKINCKQTIVLAIAFPPALLLSSGEANVNAKDRATPLLIAAQEGHAECVELLLSEGADPNLYCNEDNWQLPIHAAAEMGHKNILKLLIPITNRICDKEKSKVSPVYSALYGGNKECLEMLLKEGYSPDAQECLLWKTNGTSSSLCAADRFFNLIDILLNYGVTLLGINLGYCLYHEKFTLFRRFLKMGCPLPSHQELPEFLSYAVKALAEYKEWLPYLLLAAVIPPLSHLCRLEIRSILGSERLRSDRFIRALPLPACLQDDLLYLQLLRVSTVPGAEENLRHREEGAPSAAASSSDHTEKGDACSSPAR
uniref:Ankyrin repeat and SOCS box containing 3 n=1 Tax=Pavo cristatus TaxID=9049 RepID=A0A8C9L1L2_PAVCR